MLDRPKPSTAVPMAQPAVDAIDDGALRYYASQNDLARVSAEIRRIRIRHPDWGPPEDLFSPAGSGEDEQPLWDLYAKNDLAGLKARIDDIRQNKPDWQPSPDLSTKVHQAEVRVDLVQASENQQWGTVVDLASANGAMLSCANVDVLWRTAEALVRLGDEAKATEAYRYILTACDNATERLATVQKAGLLLKASGAVDALVQLGHRQPDGRGEFDGIRLDSVRQRVGAAAAAKSEAAEQDVASLAQSYAVTHSDSDAQLLGWYFYARKSLPDAERWFRDAMAAKPTAKSAEGLVLALRDQNKIAEAEMLALRFQDADPLNRKQVVELASVDLLAGKPVAPNLMSAFTNAVEMMKSPEGAQAYGWSLYRTGKADLASTWFKKSIEWQPNEGAVIGLVVTSNKLRQSRVVAELVAKYRDTYPKLAELEVAMRPSRAVHSRVAQLQSKRHVAQVAAGSHDGRWDASADAIVEVYRSGHYDQALAMLDSRQQSKTEPHGLSVIRGWTQYHRGDWGGAQKTFGALSSTQVAREAQDGLRTVDQGFNPRLYH